MNDQAWTANEMDILAIRFLDWVDSYEASGSIPAALAFYSDESEVTDEQRERLIAVVKDLHDRDLIGGHATLGGWGTFSAMLTPAGRRLVSSRRERRLSRRARSIAARDSLLDWMFENTSDASGESPEFETFAGTPHAHIEGDPFTASEISAAVKHLRDEQYISGIASWGDDLARPSLTSKGHRAVESGEYSAQRPTAGGTHHTLNVHGDNYGQAATGQSVTQHQTVAVGPGHLPDLIAAVRGAMSEVSENDVSGVEAYLNMIDTAARSDEPSRGVLEVAGRELLKIGDRATGTLADASIRTLWAYLVDRFGFSGGQ